ncbi:hypothetical protein [Paenibacillus lautus]|nr:hypothetical protein [Paenibacillus lautus]
MSRSTGKKPRFRNIVVLNAAMIKDLVEAVFTHQVKLLTSLSIHANSP